LTLKTHRTIANKTIGIENLLVKNVKSAGRSGGTGRLYRVEKQWFFSNSLVDQKKPGGRTF